MPRPSPSVRRVLSARAVPILRRLAGSGRAPAASGPATPPPGAADRGQWAHFPRDPLPEVPPEDLRPWPFPAWLDNPAVPWLAALKRIYATPLSFPSSISPEGGLLLHAIARNAQPRTVVETGTFLGVSTLWLAAAVSEGGGAGAHVHSFDDFGPVHPGPWRTASLPEGRRALVESHLREAGVAGRVTLHEGLSPEGIRRWRAAAGGPRVQFAFLDGDHSEEGAWADFLALEPALDTGGLVVLHDTFPEICGWDGPRRLIDHIHERSAGRYRAMDLYLAPVNYGLAVLQRVG